MATPNTLTITIAKQKVDTEAEYRALIQGIQTVYGGVASYFFLGKTYTQAELVAKLQTRIDASEATKRARTPCAPRLRTKGP
ncbi:MAG: hypothetical protein JOZ69_02250, partial [Myxococcales bacterium]|nr:hypothetical protein [Myxococcales bacterium]